MNYFDSIRQDLKDYFYILSQDIPEWLNDYIDTDAMQRIGYISYDNGNDYVSFNDSHDWYSNLDHSVGVALMIWHFTHDKAQTLAGLFHDIATPSFKHCIDFMYGDTEKQEATEDKTRSIIANDKKIMELLIRDGISLDQVCDYHMYPIADNDTPQLSCDRFEYNFSCGYFFHPEIWTLDEIKKAYDDVCVVTNEKGEQELGFKTFRIAEDYIHRVSKLWPYWIKPSMRITQQFYADIVSLMIEYNYLTEEDLYVLKEREVISRIENCPNKYIRDSFNKFKKLNKCYMTVENDNNYKIDVKTKRRFVNPLVVNELMYGRIYSLSDQALMDIEEYFKIPIEGTIEVDLEFSKDKVKKLMIDVNPVSRTK